MKNFKTIPIAAVLGCLLAVNVFAFTDQDDKKRPPKNDNTVIILEEKDKKRPPSNDKKDEREKKPEKKPSAQIFISLQLLLIAPVLNPALSVAPHRKLFAPVTR